MSIIKKELGRLKAMTKKVDLLSLQNGSDIRGFALDTESQKKNLTEETVRSIAQGFSWWLNQQKAIDLPGAAIAVGHDSRLSGPEIKEWLIEEFTALGINVYDVGMATTPALFMATQYDEFKADAGIMITASHLPMEYNGLKFFIPKGGLEHEDIEEILKYAQKEKSLEKTTDGKVFSKNLLEVYAQDLVNKIRSGVTSAGNHPVLKPLEGKKIIVDAGNGAGGFFATKVLKPLGADIEGSQFLDPDGKFPNHEPNPDNKEAMKSIGNAVMLHQADLGIIFDTDVDRSAIVDRQGKSINRNNLIGLIGAIVLEDNPKSTIVTNSPVSNHLETFIENLGGQVDRYISGYRNVINRGIALNEQGIDCALAIETSGHAALRENYFLDDGSYLAAKILIKEAELSQSNKSVVDLIRDLKQPAETEEVRFIIQDANVLDVGQTILDAFKAWLNDTDGFEVVEKNHEGIRSTIHDPFGDGWLLLRMSLHEPKLVLQMENDKTGVVSGIKETLKDFFYKFDTLDNSQL